MFGLFWQVLAKKDHIKGWMLPADIRNSRGSPGGVQGVIWQTRKKRGVSSSGPTAMQLSEQNSQCSQRREGENESQGWEVLNGVGVDGVGGIFPFFSAFSFGFSSLFRFSSFFFAFLRFFSFSSFSSFFFVFLRFSPIFLGQEQTTAICWENGNFTPTPSAPTRASR